MSHLKYSDFKFFWQLAEWGQWNSSNTVTYVDICEAPEKTNSKTCQTSKMELFAKILNGCYM